MLTYVYENTAIIAGGTWSGTTLFISGGLCRQVYVKATTASTTYNATMIDEGNRTIRSWSGNEQLINDLTAFPVYGKYTFNITNSNANEPFDILLHFVLN